jgi:hypothetical protein
MLPLTVSYYKNIFPSCKITIYDNESTDNSVEIAKSLNCDVITWSSGNIIDDNKYRDIKNSCWKGLSEGWVIVADMDEWLDITQEELEKESELGVSIITTKGLNMIGESNSLDLSDINLCEIKKYVKLDAFSKKICFLREKITDMNYDYGAHNCKPEGNLHYSSKEYYMKHMSYLGLPFLTDKWIKRYQRSELMRSKGLAVHYTDDLQKIEKAYESQLKSSKIL